MAKRALVTGASRGLGRAVANHLSRKGYQVLISSSDNDEIDKILRELDGEGHKAVPADLASDQDTENLAAETIKFSGEDGLSIFFNAAAATVDPEAEAELSGTDMDTLSRHIAISSKAPLALLKALKGTFEKAGTSHAITMGTDWNIEGLMGPPAFAAAKAFAMESWNHSRKEYLRVGCVLSVIVAGNVATYDEDWEEPKWTIDDDVEDVRKELGITRVPIHGVIQAFDLITTAPISAVTKVEIIPVDPDYEA